LPLIYGGLADAALHGIPQHLIPVPYCMPPQPYAVSDKPYVRGLVTLEKLAAKAAEQQLQAAAARELYLQRDAEAVGVQSALLEQYLQLQQQCEQVSDEEAEQEDSLDLCDDTDSDIAEDEGDDT
jgi:hypothetical protein